MSVVFSGSNSGSFTSTGSAYTIVLPSNLDWLNVYNYTQMATTQSTGRLVQAYWQRGFPAGAGIAYDKANSANTLTGTVVTTGFFNLVNNTVSAPGPLVATTAISTATPPVVSTGSTAGLVNGSVVRMINNTGAHQLDGYAFTIGSVVTNTSFTLANMQPIAAGTAGFWQLIPYGSYWYPNRFNIGNISQATQAIVTLLVTHNFTVGQKISFRIPVINATSFGMTQLNDVEATIVAINQADTDGYTNTITINIDTTGYNAFVFPTTALSVGGFTPAQVIPVGQDTAFTLQQNGNILADSTINQGYMGISLGAGAGYPAGSNGDVIYWVAGKSFNGI